jgi:hypothetical protein
VCAIVLTADTYISVLPDVARQAAEDTATLVIQAGYLVPGTSRPAPLPLRLRQEFYDHVRSPYL